MPSRLASRGLRRVSVSLLLLAGCEFTIADWYYIDRPRVMGTRAIVVELSPVWPDRVGFDPLDPPIVEPLPGDRLRLEPMIVDGEGRMLDPDGVDALWFQCGVDRCIRPDSGELALGMNTPCSDLPEWTMDSTCQLGSAGAIEFVVPALGQLTVFTRYSNYYMVASADGSRTAAECWEARKRGDASLDGCLFADRELKVGPSWVLLALAELAGLEPDIPIFEIPAAAFLQGSNREPVLGDVVLGDRIVGPSSGPIQVRPGETFTATRPEWRLGFDQQVYFAARETVTPDSYVFVVLAEYVWFEWYTSGSLVRLDLGDIAGYAEFLIDEQAKPGTTSRLIMLWGDDRGAQAMRVVELEVVE